MTVADSYRGKEDNAIGDGDANKDTRSQTPEHVWEPWCLTGLLCSLLFTSQHISTPPLQGVSLRWVPAWSFCLSGSTTAWYINSSSQNLPGTMSGAWSWGRGQSWENCSGFLKVSYLLMGSYTPSTPLPLSILQEDFPGTAMHRQFIKGIHFLNFHINPFPETICLRTCLECSTSPHLLFKFFFSYFIFTKAYITTIWSSHATFKCLTKRKRKHISIQRLVCDCLFFLL